MENNVNIATATSDNINSLPTQAGEGEAPNSAENLPATANDEPFLEIKYLKQSKGLTKEQAKELCEIGMHYSSFKDRLENLAGQKNMNLKQFLDSLENPPEVETQQEQAPTDENERIANEFELMLEDFDEVKSIHDLPPAVLEAANNGMPLAYAYLLNKYLTENQSKTQNAAELKAASKTVGALADNQLSDPIADRFIKSLWGS